MAEDVPFTARFAIEELSEKQLKPFDDIRTCDKGIERETDDAVVRCELHDDGIKSELAGTAMVSGISAKNDGA